MVNQHLRRHPLNADPMPDQTYFQDQRAYNLLYRMRGDLVLIDQLIDSLYQARRLLQFVTTGPGLPGQYRINPTASLSSTNLAILHNTPPGFPLPPEPSSRSPSPAPHTPPQDAARFHHYWTGPPPRATPAPTSAMPLAHKTVLDPATPTVAKRSLHYHSNLAARDLQRLLCSFLHLRRLLRPQLLIHLAFKSH